MTDQLTESREELYYPSPDVLSQAYIKDWDELARQAEEDFVGFWEERAKELIDWLRHGARCWTIPGRPSISGLSMPRPT
jgi:acetyl-CoA synthetase